MVWTQNQNTVSQELLFIVYINDLSSSLDLSNFIYFADAATVSIRDNNFEALSYKRNVVLDLLNKWTIRNRLTIRFDKTEFMMI